MTSSKNTLGNDKYRQPALLKPLVSLTLLLSVVWQIPASRAAADVFKSDCGKTRFFINVLNKGFVFDNSYRLTAETEAGFFELFTGSDQFYAACIKTAAGNELLVFQSFCTGSACIEQNYGVVEPVSLKLLLQPGQENTANSQALANLLGYAAPNLSIFKETFCCNALADATTSMPEQTPNQPAQAGLKLVSPQPPASWNSVFYVDGLGLLLSIWCYRRLKSKTIDK